MNLKVVFKILIIILCIPLIATCDFFGDPKIDVTCSINGFGSGECQFTNTGNASGTLCGKVIITSKLLESTESKTICSGKVEHSSTNTVSVHIPGMKELCDYTVCTYSWDP